MREPVKDGMVVFIAAFLDVARRFKGTGVPDSHLDDVPLEALQQLVVRSAQLLIGEINRLDASIRFFFELFAEKLHSLMNGIANINGMRDF